MTSKVINLGCRLNAYEGDVVHRLIEGQARQRVVINTCAVTAEAERQGRQIIRKAARENPKAEIVVTGCAAQIHPETYAAMAEVTRVVGNEEKIAATHLGPFGQPPPRFGGRYYGGAGNRATPSRPSGRARVPLCRCSRAAIIAAPFASSFGRGNSRSVPVGDVVRQVRALVESGTKEVVLTGVDLTSYGPDLPGQPTLGQMARRLLAQVPELRRLRLSSIDCIEIDSDLKTLLAEEPRLMPHLHLSLQAGHDLTLKRMKRRHSRAEAVALCREIRNLRPDIAFGADLIAGFPHRN